MRIGMDNIHGYITPEQLADFEKGNLKSYQSMDKTTVKEKIAEEDVQLIDIRKQSEYKEGHIDGAINIYIGTLDENFDKIDKKREAIIYCNSGNRSAVAYSLLVANGFDNISNYSGGWSEWSPED